MSKLWKSSKYSGIGGAEGIVSVNVGILLDILWISDEFVFSVSKSSEKDWLRVLFVEEGHGGPCSSSFISNARL